MEVCVRKLLRSILGVSAHDRGKELGLRKQELNYAAALVKASAIFTEEATESRQPFRAQLRQGSGVYIPSPTINLERTPKLRPGGLHTEISKVT